jgi:hypothetical protein
MDFGLARELLNLIARNHFFRKHDSNGRLGRTEQAEPIIGEGQTVQSIHRP